MIEIESNEASCVTKEVLDMVEVQSCMEIRSLVI
jgi:hypothetical protein